MTRLTLLAAACLCAGISAASAQSFTFTTIDNPGDPTFNQLLGINDNGFIVGYFGSGLAGHPNIAYQLSPPYTKFVSDMVPGSVQTQATGINNAGVISGFWSGTNTGNGDANYGFVRLPIGKTHEFFGVVTPGASNNPAFDQTDGVNNKNVAVGFSTSASGVLSGFTYTVSTATYTTIRIPGATGTQAFGINDAGETCGAYITSTATGGFVSNAAGTVVTKFSVPGSTNTQLFGINNEGVAVGAFVDSNMIAHGLYYTPSNGNWVQVDNPNGPLGTVLNGLNNKGQIVGFYTDAAGNVHGMLVTVTK
jgi:hypothetical protein